MATAPTLLTLPAEIRLAIYECLLVDHEQQVVSIRSENPASYAQRRRTSPVQHLRTPYWVHPDPYRPAYTAETSYILQPGEGCPTIHASILGVNRQIHAEASRVLYGSYVFDFGTDVESAVPFLSDRTPPSLSAIRRINLVKRPWPSYLNEQYKWSAVCAYVAGHLQLQHLGLSVFGGKVDAARYQPRNTLTKSDFSFIAHFDGMEWVQHLLAIKVRNLDITTIWERCPAPCSNSLAFFVDFSASIEKGFAEYLRENMVAGAA